MDKKKQSTIEAKLTEGAVGKLLIRMTIPMIFGIVSMGLYNIVDTFFVGQLGKEQLAALAFTFPVVLVVQSLALGIGMGTAAVVSRALGERNQKAVQRFATDSLILGLLIVGIFAAIGLATIDPLFRLLGAEGIILNYIHQYMSVWYPGMMFVIVPMIGNNSIRATGDTRTPGTVMVIGAVVNAIMDPLLIFGLGPFPALGITGAAAATLIGRSVTFTVALYVLIVREKLITFKLPRLKEIMFSWGQVLYIGIPNAATKMIVPLGAGVVTRILAQYGPEVVAGYGVATRIEFFSLAVINALSSVIGPFIGQNIGAGLTDRVKEGFKKSELFCLLIGGFLFLLFLFSGAIIAGLFNDNPQVVKTTSS
ncbi:MAG: MATE family efflux transporter, partial [Spirochaetes bacterium]